MDNASESSTSAIWRLARRLWPKRADERFRALELELAVAQEQTSVEEQPALAAQSADQMPSAGEKQLPVEEPSLVEDEASDESIPWYCLSNRTKNILWSATLLALGFAAIGLETFPSSPTKMAAEVEPESKVLGSESQVENAASMSSDEVDPPRELDPTLLQAQRLEPPPALPPPAPVSISFDPAPNSAPIGEPLLLLVTVHSKDGIAVGDAAVEWSLDRHGVGEIAIVPGSEANAKASEKTLPTFARTHSSKAPYDVRLSDSKDDAIEVGVGQTWVVVQSSRPGEMIVHVVAPAIESLPRRRIFHRILWTAPTVREPETPPLAAMPSVHLPPEPAAKLVLQKQVPNTWWAGRSARITITVENQGTADAFGIRVSDDIPLGLRIEQSDAVVSDGQLNWNIDHLRPGGLRTFVVQASPQQPFENLLLRTQAMESGRLACEILTSLSVRGVASLSLEARDVTDPVPVGGLIEYVLTLKNTGSVSACDLKVETSLSKGAIPVSVEGELAGMVREGALVFDPISQLAPGQILSCTVRAKALTVGEVRLSSRLSHPSLGPRGILAEESSLIYKP